MSIGAVGGILQPGRAIDPTPVPLSGVFAFPPLPGFMYKWEIDNPSAFVSFLQRDGCCPADGQPFYRPLSLIPLFSRRPHLVHCMLAASHVWDRELYDKVRGMYNSVHPIGYKLAPPFEEWTGMRGLCNHIFCRCDECGE